MGGFLNGLATYLFIPLEQAPKKTTTLKAGYWKSVRAFQSMYRILQGAVAIIFGTAIIKSSLFRRWIGVLGIISGAPAITTGVIVAYVLFSSVRDPVADTETVVTFVWLIVLGIFMWKRSMKK